MELVVISFVTFLLGIGAGAAGVFYWPIPTKDGSAVPLIPPPSYVRIRYLDAHGQLVGEQLVDRRFRRPERQFAGATFHAEGQMSPDVWDYRWLRNQ